MSVHNGHRERMRQEFLSGGLAHFSEPRVLELLLFLSALPAEPPRRSYTGAQVALAKPHRPRPTSSRHFFRI